MEQLKKIPNPDKETSTAIFSRSVKTRYTFDFNPSIVWNHLVFYEHIKRKKPFLLRFLLPIPIGTEGHVTKEGDMTLCIYRTGYLRKKLTKVVEGQLYQFKIVEQKLPLRTGIKLSGGCYSLTPLHNGRTEVIITTHYFSKMSPRWIWSPVEKIVCDFFHRYLLRSIRKNVTIKAIQYA